MTNEEAVEKIKEVLNNYFTMLNNSIKANSILIQELAALKAWKESAEYAVNQWNPVRAWVRKHADSRCGDDIPTFVLSKLQGDSTMLSKEDFFELLVAYIHHSFANVVWDALEAHGYKIVK
jgi:hypothetical protein